MVCYWLCKIHPKITLLIGICPLGYLEWIGLSITIHENRVRTPLQPGIFFRILGYIRQLWPLLRHLQLTLPQIRLEVSSGLLGTAPPHQCKKGG